MRRRLNLTEGGVIGRDLDPDGPTPKPHHNPKGWQQRAIQNDRDRAELLNVMRQLTAHMGGILNQSVAAPKADVLAQMTQVIPSNGVLQRRWKQDAQAVCITNYGMATLTVTTQGMQSQAPSVGSGVALVAGGTERTIALRGTTVTIYGNPGTIVELVAFSRPRPPHSAPAGSGTTDGVLIPAGTTVSQTIQLAQVSAERLVVVQNIAAAAGTLQTTINGVTPSGYIYPLLIGLAENTIGATPLRIGPALNSSPNAVANDVVPRELQIVATVAGGAVTYGLDFVAGR